MDFFELLTTMKVFNNVRSLLAFSLIEVIVATAIFATSAVAIIGLMGPISRNVENAIDSETAARLAQSIQDELKRIGYETVGNDIVSTPVYLYATSEANRVLVGPDPSVENSSSVGAVNNDLETESPPGIAKRDRFFLVTLEDLQPFGGAFDDNVSGSIPLRATVVWPYRVPSGPASDLSTSGGDPDFDPSVMVSAADRFQLNFFFSLAP